VRWKSEAAWVTQLGSEFVGYDMLATCLSGSHLRYSISPALRSAKSHARHVNIVLAIAALTILAPAPSAAQPNGAAHRKAGEEDAFLERSELMEVYEIPLSSIYRATEQGNPAMTIDIGQGATFSDC